jgi:hypothetical protein
MTSQPSCYRKETEQKLKHQLITHLFCDSGHRPQKRDTVPLWPPDRIRVLAMITRSWTQLQTYCSGTTPRGAVTWHLLETSNSKSFSRIFTMNARYKNSAGASQVSKLMAWKTGGRFPSAKEIYSMKAHSQRVKRPDSGGAFSTSTSIFMGWRFKHRQLYPLIEVQAKATEIV